MRLKSEITVPASKIPTVPPRILLGPGPSNVSPRVLQAMTQSMLGHLDPDFLLILDEVADLLTEIKSAWQQMAAAARQVEEPGVLSPGTPA